MLLFVDVALVDALFDPMAAPVGQRSSHSAAPRVSGIIRPRPTVDRHPPGSSPEHDARSARLGALVDRHFDFVWRSARRLGLHAADADDVTQDVFIVAARRLDEVEPDRERSFLFGTLLRVAATRRRADGRRREALIETADRHAGGLDPEQLSELVSARPLLQEILDGLPPPQHAVFVLYELEELSLPEIAEVLGVPIGTVSSRLRSARAAFRAAARRLQVREGSVLRLVAPKPAR
jgi:RNA polymerase sigma-70 factor, ECF subfamily